MTRSRSVSDRKLSGLMSSHLPASSLRMDSRAAFVPLTGLDSSYDGSFTQVTDVVSLTTTLRMKVPMPGCAGVEGEAAVQFAGAGSEDIAGGKRLMGARLAVLASRMLKPSSTERKVGTILQHIRYAHVVWKSQ